MAASSAGGGCSVPAVPDLGGYAHCRRAAGASTPPFRRPETPAGTSLPFPVAGDSPWAPVPGWNKPSPPYFAGATQAKVDQGKGVEPCCCTGGGDAPPLHGEVTRGGPLHHPPFFNTMAAWHHILFGFTFSIFFFFPPVFVSRSDISADGQAMTAANGSRALSLVSLATAGRENRTCQMENVNYSGCGGERCCEQRRRAVAAGGARRRRAAQWRAGWMGCPAAPSRQTALG